MAAVLGEQVEHHLADVRVSKHRLGPLCDLAKQYPHSFWHVLARSLAGLEVDVDGAIFAGGVQLVS